MKLRKQNVLLFLLMLLAVLSVSVAQAPVDSALEAKLKQVFPSASSFSPKQSTPLPHFVAYTGSGTSKTIAGYVFWSTELEPYERGYDGPIKMLVGVDLKGLLTGVLVVEHHEPYGNFSVEPPEFARQFKGKSITDPFKVGSDVNAVSRATISVTSASKVIRNGSRRLAKALIAPPAK
jgi:NosR/NirI family nitrous oxide reductase transcriptional regulator